LYRQGLGFWDKVAWALGFPTGVPVHLEEDITSVLQLPAVIDSRLRSGVPSHVDTIARQSDLDLELVLQPFTTTR